MEWKYNGFIVTQDSPGKYTKPGSCYHGVASGEPWPLQYRDDLSRGEVELVERVWALTLYHAVKRSDGLPAFPATHLGSFPPSLVSDLDTVEKYIQLCRERNICVRVLLCATTCDYPQVPESILDELTSKSEFLGYDYASHDCVYSAMHADLAWFASSEVGQSTGPWNTTVLEDAKLRMHRYTLLLNEYGLFGNTALLEEYIAERWSILRQYDNLLEGHMDFWPFEVREVTRALKRLFGMGL